jgi:Asp-tRNA(Asn)/Glu-tRNA(Gln) amidotransferase A subunit family amidase
VDVTLPREFQELEDAHRWISGFEMARNLTWEIDNHWNDISEQFRDGRLKDGLACTYDHYVAMRNVMHHCRKLLLHVFDEHDIVLTAAAAGEAPVGLENAVANPWVYMVWTTLHVPSISIPVFKGPAGLPIGAQFIAKHHEDRRLFSAAQWAYEVLTKEQST